MKSEKLLDSANTLLMNDTIIETKQNVINNSKVETHTFKDEYATSEQYISEKEPDKSDEYTLVPPDGGWGWIVALGACIITTLLPTVGNCFGIFFSGYLNEHGTSSTTIGWIFNIQMLMWHLAGPLVNSLTIEFGYRKVGYIGIILTSLSMIISAFSPSPGFLFFSYSIISGIGCGLAMTESIMVVPQYFDRRQGLANAALMTGICLSQIAGAPLAGYLLEEYGFRGSTILFGAILLNGLVAVSVFHPVEWHKKKVKLCQIDSSSCQKLPLKPTIEGTDNMQSKQHVSLQTLKKDNMEWTASCEYAINISKSTNEISQKVKEPSNGNLNRFCAILIRVSKSAISDFKIARNYRAIIISSGIAFSVIGYVNFLMMLPFSMTAQGFSLDDASKLISMLGMSNMVIRLTVSPLADWKRFNKRLCIMSGYAIVSVCIFIFSFLSTMQWMIPTMIVMGCGIGCNMTLNNLVMIKYLGRENLPPCLGVTTLIVGIGAMLFGPFLGFIRDMTGSFAISMWIMSAMLAASFTLWLFMPAAIKADLKREFGNKETQA